MKRYTPFSALLTIAALLCLVTPLPALAGSEFIAVAYHDVVNHRSELTYDAVTMDNLIDHFEWLKAEGYQPVSVDDLQAARAGTRPLPDKAILLCWDDAYTSFYTHVLPLLKAYNYPAVLALVGTWMAPGPDEMVQYGDELVPRKKFMTWQQVKEVAASGLVEIASHSNNLHTAVLADQSGDRLPATIAHSYDPVAGTYETDEQFKQRVHNDLQAGSDLMLQHLGFRPRVLVWPFGRYNTVARRIAAEVGMSITLTLNPVPADTDQLEAVGRLYPTSNPDLKTFRSYLKSQQILPPVKRFFRVNSLDLLEPSLQKEEHFGSFLDRVKDLDPNVVILDPIVEVNGVRKALFTNSRFPLAQDRLTRLCWHTSKRAGAGVFLWLPSSLFTPLAGETGETINRFFSDMGKSAPGEGVVVNDPDLVRELLKLAGNANKKASIRFWNPDKQRQARQTQSKAGDNPQVSRSFQALEAFQQWQPFQEVGLVVSSDRFKTMGLPEFNTLLSFFDFLILDTGKENIRSLGNAIAPQLELLEDAGYLRKCVVLLSTEAGDTSLAGDMKRLPSLNIINWGYQFDRFLEGSPSPDSIRPLLSKKSFPYPLTP